jgi:hypothetical protein
MIKNGVLAELLRNHPDLKYLFCHNIDTVGANLEPALLGLHIKNRSVITYEVTPRRVEDAGGGLARVDGHLRLVEGLALPDEETEYRLRYYNTLTNWITIDSLLGFFGLTKSDLTGCKDTEKTREKIDNAIYRIEKIIPTYVTIKDVRQLWGAGQEDVYPVSQFEKLWGDMTAVKDLKVNYVGVSRYRGQQLKEPSLLDMWANDGSLEHLKSKLSF